MKKGRLKWRVTIERFTVTQDDFNEDIEAWAPLATRSAAIYYGKGEERREAAMETASQAASFEMIADSVTRSVTVKDRLSYDGGTWDITGISPLGRSGISFTATRAL